VPRRGGESRVPGIGAVGDGIDRVVGRFVPAVVQQIDVDEVVYDRGDRPVEMPAPITRWFVRHGVDSVGPGAGEPR